jgi:hypothetical protein
MIGDRVRFGDAVFCLLTSHTFCHPNLRLLPKVNKTSVRSHFVENFTHGMSLDRLHATAPPVVPRSRKGALMTLIVTVLFFFNIYSRLGSHLTT